MNKSLTVNIGKLKPPRSFASVTGGSSPQPLSLLRQATLVQIQGSTFNTGNKYECAKVNNLL